MLRLFPLFFLDPATVIRDPLINVSSFEDPNVFEEHVEGGYIRVYIQGVNIYLMETSFSILKVEINIKVSYIYRNIDRGLFIY